MSGPDRLTLYGIRQCDSCRKSLKWLAGHDLEHEFHDFRVDGPDAQMLKNWMTSTFADQLVNRRSTTWRSLTPDERSASGEALLAVLIAKPTLIKRPVVTINDEIVMVGFHERELAARFGIES